jgi:hypothetical protein
LKFLQLSYQRHNASIIKLILFILFTKGGTT